VRWLPEDADFLTVFGAATGAVATLIAIVASIAQLTLGARARHVLDWTTQALATEINEARSAALTQLKLAVQGRLLAAHYVPGWRFIEPLLWTLWAPLSLFLSARGDGSAWSALLAIAFSLSLFALPMRRGIRLYAERYRVMHQFVNGIDFHPIRTDLMEQMEGGTRREFRLAYIGAAATLTLGASGAWVATAPRSFLPWAAAVAALVAVWSSAEAIRKYVRRVALNPPRHAVEV